MSPTKTSASSVAVADTVPLVPNSGYGISHSDAIATADLAAGTLKIAHHSTSAGIGSDSTFSGAQAQFRDVLRFTQLTTPIDLIVNLRIDGLFDGFTQPGFSFGLSGRDSLLAEVVRADNNANGPSTTQTAAVREVTKVGDWSIYGPDRFVGKFTLTPPDSEIVVSMGMRAGGGSNAFSEFDHTAAVTFTLPDGVTFTSQSGAFLTTASASVPEPITWATMLVGFGLVGGAVRRRTTLVPISGTAGG